MTEVQYKLGLTSCASMFCYVLKMYFPDHLSPNLRTSNPSDWKVVLGRHQQHAGGTEFDVTSIILHDDYNSGTSENDLAVLVLSEPAQLTRTVNLVCLPPSGDEQGPGIKSFGNESNCFITGWGHTACECETF